MKKVMIGLVAVVLVAVGYIAMSHRGNEESASSAPQIASQTATSAPDLPPAQGSGLPQSYNAGFPFRDTSVLRPPAGQKVAIYEFDDLECPGCAQAMPVVHAAAERHGIPVEHHDFPWTEMHVWSFEAAVTARYLQDDVSPQVADEFRKDVFANQRNIASKEDLSQFTQAWFQSHGRSLPFVLDPNGTCKTEVQADRALGDRVGVKSTPCIFVVTEHGFAYVQDLHQIDQMIETAQAGKA